MPVRFFVPRRMPATPSGDHPPVHPTKPPRPLLTRTGLAAALLFLALCAAAPLGPFAFEAEWLQRLRVPEDALTMAGPHWLGTLMRDATALGGSPILTLMTILLAGFLALRREWRTLALVLVVVIGQSLIVDALKALFDRPRPDIVPAFAEVASRSFPSGHAASAASVYLLLAILAAPLLKDRRSRVYLFVAAAILALLIGASRMFLGVHYPTDVLAGWSFGTSWTCGVVLLARRWSA